VIIIKTIKDIVVDLLVYNKLDRFSRLCKVLKANGIVYKAESLTPGTTNIVISLGSRNADTKHIVLGAHYDVYPGSLGINDNTISVAMLIKFAILYISSGSEIPIDIVFFDKEESGMIGSRDYANKNKCMISYALIFDIIGFGDTLVCCSEDKELKDYLFEAADIYSLTSILPSDNLSLQAQGIPSALIVSTKQSDLVKCDTFSYSLVNHPEFYATFHGRIDDNDMSILTMHNAEELLVFLETWVL